MIAGGYRNDQMGNMGEGHASDAFIFDTDSLKLQSAEVWAPEEAVPKQFDSLTNQSREIRNPDGSTGVVALIEDIKETLHIIHFGLKSGVSDA